MKTFFLSVTALISTLFMGASYLTTGKETLVENIPVSNTYTGAKPKNIILLIGDGMGLAQITAGLYANGNSLQLEKFPITGLILTHSARQLITDSAAGATAFSCGCKTNNGYIGVTTKKKHCLTILEQAKKEGKAVGLVASSSLTHATPASFIAHVADRGESENIATFFADTEVDLSIGGGMQYFNQRKTDQRDIYKELAQKGVVISDFTKQSLSETRPDPANPFMWFAAEKEPASATEGRTYLPLAARLATTFLKKRSEKGFFLMLEGSQIDWACHAKKGPEAVREMLDFDNAIGEILRFAQRDGETLVIVTADHETGGMTLEQSNTPDNVDLDFNTGNHTASMVPVFAFGPGAELFGGLYDNTEIYVKMRDLFGWKAVEPTK
jgi:alkaline phosphatase